MKALEPNMYVRTKKGTIHKIFEIDKMLKYEKEDRLIINKDDWFLVESDLFKASHNIIDLIEEGDYVNGLRVEKSKYGELYTSYTYMGGDIGLQQETYTTFLKDYEEDDVYSILTREQFESMKYEVK